MQQVYFQGLALYLAAVPDVPVLYVLQRVWQRSVSSFRQRQGENGSQKRGSAEDDKRRDGVVVVQHVYNGRQYAPHPRKHAGHAYSCLPADTPSAKAARLHA